ncbi:hypothetical protein KP509_32G076300 [Ceratopteris richardii]|nr:hypothetical protein KP509_32G076300 [Ceratopteris richardii]
MGSFAGLVPKNVTSLPPPNASTSLSETPLQMTAEVAEKRGTATLTIFYGGNVNVFEDITAEKAQAIMFLASNGNLQGMSPTDALYGSEKKMEVTPESVPKTNAGNMTMASTKASTINVINFVNGVQLDQMNGYKVESCKTNNNQAGLSVQLDFVHASIPAAASNEEQPGVPSALPQARKASLARFLEKRRERVLSKSPYSLKQADSTLPEERTSSSNDIISCRRYGNNEKKISLPGWLEGFPGYPCDVVAKAE